MTFPITPLPGIHHDVMALQEAERQLQIEIATLEKIFGTLAQQILTGLINAILNALGLSSFVGPLDAALAEVENALGHIPGSVISGITALEQQILDAIANALGHAGTGHTVAQVESYLEAIPASVIQSVFGGSSLGADVQGFMSSLGSIFPKALPWTIGTSTNTNLANLVSQDKFQQLLDGLAGTAGSNVQQAVAAVQSGLATARSDVAQAVVDGVNSVNAHTAVSQALQAIPNPNITSVIESGENLGADVLAAFSGFVNLLSGHPAVGASVQAVNATGATGGEYVVALNQHITGSGASSGLDVTVDFSKLPNASNLVGAGFTQSGATMPKAVVGAPNTTPITQVVGIGVNSGVAEWLYAMSPGSIYYDLELYSTPTNTDYQVIGQTFSSSGTYFNHLIGRSNALGTDFVVAAFDEIDREIILYAVVGGVSTLLAAVLYTPASGVLYQLECGNPETADLYEFTVYANGVPVLDYIDSVHVSQLGSSHRYSGTMMSAYTVHPTPSNLSSWGVYDNAPPAVIGSIFRAYSTITSATAFSSVTTFVSNGTTFNVGSFPASFFGNTQWQSSDYAWNSVTNTLTIGITGTYEFKVATGVTASGGDTLVAAIFHNGSLVQTGGGPAVSGGYGFLPLKDGFTLFCQAGDTISPGISWNVGAATPQVVSDSGGVTSYFSAALCNCGTVS